MSQRLAEYRDLLAAYHEFIRRPGWHLDYQRRADGLAEAWGRLTPAEQKEAEKMQRQEYERRGGWAPS